MALWQSQRKIPRTAAGSLVRPLLLPPLHPSHLMSEAPTPFHNARNPSLLMTDSAVAIIPGLPTAPACVLSCRRVLTTSMGFVTSAAQQGGIHGSGSAHSIITGSRIDRSRQSIPMIGAFGLSHLRAVSISRQGTALIDDGRRPQGFITDTLGLRRAPARARQAWD